ncbi:MAG: tetratricopeptide repeat protein [Phycisphaerales bacterium]|nr:tetratricopeptide repeat protein [Phycisphaerales bacterium]
MSTARPVLVGLLACGYLGACSPEGRPAPGATAPADATRFVGRAACAECHQNEHALWLGSHHDLAMQEATAETVLGDFGGVTLEHFGVTSRFFTRDGGYFVETDGPDGSAGECRVAYTFGVTPLQQYLVEFPGGRLQSLPLCWDARPAAEGGQRWFHLYSGEPIPAGDELHWTGRNQNWNFMCAECHSTDLHKRYDPQTDAFETVWSEIDVSCEACHGPGSAHVDWAERAGEGATAADAAEAGLGVGLTRAEAWPWVFTEGSPTAVRIEERTEHAEIEACARCHSRRAALTDDYTHGRPLLGTHRLSLLTEPEYFADGQILGENYEHGSFLQSKMYHAGVTCAECHDPHTARLVAEGDALCFRCHQPEVFGAASHHRHPGGAGAPGTSCVDCHMPVRTYMVVDDRRDHSFRVPRPDLSEQLGTPNACNGCHTEESASWAAARVAEWYGEGRRAEWHFGEALHAGRGGLPGAGALLLRLANDAGQPAIARATGFTLLTPAAGPGFADTVRAGLGDADPVVRLGALQAVAAAAPEQRLGLGAALLEDPVLAVRAEAARVLAASVGPGAPAGGAFERAGADFVASQMASAERPESRVNLGVYFTDLGMLDRAEAEYRAALRLDPASIAAGVNLADLRRLQGRDAEGERVLRDTLRLTPRNASVRHALGLTLVRLGRRDEALAELERAFAWGPESPRHGYVFAVALDSLGEPDRALEVMRSTVAAHPYDREVLGALAGMCQARGLGAEAGACLDRLEALDR